MTYTLFYALLFSVVICGTGKLLLARLGFGKSKPPVSNTSGSAVPDPVTVDPFTASPRLYLSSPTFKLHG